MPNTSDHDLTGRPIAEIHLTLRGGRPLPAKLPAGHLPAPATEQQLLYLHTDALDTPRLATDVRGQVVWRGDGAAFGDTRPDEDPDGDGTPTTVNLRFPGQYYDQETGLHYNWNRYYDPKSGRYVTSDPIGLAGGLNTYAYVTNNPLRYTDPSGLVTCTCQAKGGGQRTSSGEKICEYTCRCRCPNSSNDLWFEISFSAGFSNDAVCIGQNTPHYTQPGAHVGFEEFTFDTGSTIDRTLNLQVPNELMDRVERECKDDNCSK